MSIETRGGEQLAPPSSNIEIEKGYEHFFPSEFKQDALRYFEAFGANIKTGETKYKSDGSISEDPNAVKEFPAWHNQVGEALHIVAKKINLDKAMVRKSGNPAYERDFLRLVRKLGLPAPEPVAFIEQSGAFLMLMKKAPGLPWNERTIDMLKTEGYSLGDIAALESQIEAMIHDLKHQYAARAIYRPWKQNDMLVDIDIAGKQVKSVIPTDWEKAQQIDPEALLDEVEKYLAFLRDRSNLEASPDLYEKAYLQLDKSLAILESLPSDLVVDQEAHILTRSDLDIFLTWIRQKKNGA